MVGTPCVLPVDLQYWRCLTKRTVKNIVLMLVSTCLTAWDIFSRNMKVTINFCSLYFLLWCHVVGYTLENHMIGHVIHILHIYLFVILLYGLALKDAVVDAVSAHCFWWDIFISIALVPEMFSVISNNYTETPTVSVTYWCQCSVFLSVVIREASPNDIHVETTTKGFSPLENLTWIFGYGQGARAVGLARETCNPLCLSHNCVSVCLCVYV